MTQLYSLADLVNRIEIRSFREDFADKNPKGYKRYIEIEKKLISEEKAVNLESYLLQEYQFGLRSITSIAKELGVSYPSLYNLMYDLSIPIRTPNELEVICGISIETKQKMSEAKKGDKNPFYGKKGKEHPGYGRIHTPEEIESMSKANRKKVPKEKITEVCKRTDLTFEEKAEELEISVMTLYKRLKELRIKSARKKREYVGEISA
jgi:hypothetical protein